MQNSCQISIIIPAFNAEEYIEQCLDSIINQTFKDIEIIVVDDGSTDSTEKIVRRYMATDTRIRIVKQPNMHAGIARNAGKRIAIGKYLLFLDADDFYELDMLEKMYLSAEEHQTDITICRSDYYNCIANEFMVMQNSIMYIDCGTVYPRGEIADRLFQIANGWAWDKLFRRDFIEANKLEFQGLSSSDDVYFVFLAMALAQNVIAVDKTLVHHRINNPSSIENNRWKTWGDAFTAAEALEQRLKTYMLFDQLNDTYFRWLLVFGLWNFWSLNDSVRQEFFERFRREWVPRITIPASDPYVDKTSIQLLAAMKHSYFELFMDYSELLQHNYLLENEKHRTLKRLFADNPFLLRVSRGVYHLPRKIKNALSKQK